jgi:predicted DsbA family dithiol-disulfide isomerase
MRSLRASSVSSRTFNLHVSRAVSLAIDVVSDVVCPWCFIGLRRLEEAIALWAERHPETPVTVAWHAFQLNPDLPRTGVDRKTYLEQKFGGPARAREIYARVEAAGREAGIAFDFDRIRVQPNTQQAHRLIAWASQRGRGTPLVEALFRAYFLEGQDFTDDARLANAAAEAGLERDAAMAFLASDELSEDVASDESVARQIGVQGVPFFIFDRRLAASGAQPADALLAAMEEALAGQASGTSGA